MTSLAAVADELYALAPDEFIAARDAAARKARDDSDRDLAAEVKQLRRPSVGAWLVNQLARQHADRLEDLLDLGETLRAAQHALDGAELRTMTRQRRQVIRSLSELAGELAAAADRRVGDAAQREVEGTLDAALADEQAAQAVRSGRLMRALSSTGLEAVDLTDAVAAPDATAKPRRSRRTQPVEPSKGAAKKAQPGKGVRRAAHEKALTLARESLAETERTLTDHESELGAAREAVGSARERVAELETALTEASEQQSAAERDRRAADQARKSAVRARDAAQRAVDAAEKKLRN
jgi:hypothetical protein